MNISSCPFCGSKPILIYRKTFNEYFVACQTPTCRAMVGRVWSKRPEEHEFCRTPKEAIKRWNIRYQVVDYSDLETREV